jgi:hypothetical protein
METTLIRACESIAVLMAILTLGAGLGGIVSYLAMRKADRKRGRIKAHDRLRDDTERIGKYAEGQWRYGPPSVDLHVEIAKAIFADRSARSRKGWQTRRAERQRQKDADILAMIEWGKQEAGEV